MFLSHSNLPMMLFSPDLSQALGRDPPRWREAVHQPGGVHGGIVLQSPKYSPIYIYIYTYVCICNMYIYIYVYIYVYVYIYIYMPIFP